jgi:hypothetical protein
VYRGGEGAAVALDAAALADGAAATESLGAVGVLVDGGSDVIAAALAATGGAACSAGVCRLPKNTTAPTTTTAPTAPPR